MIIHNGDNWYYSKKGLMIFVILCLTSYLLGYFLEENIIVGVIFAIVMAGMVNYFILRKQFKESMSIMSVVPIWIYSLYQNIKQAKWL